MPPLGTLTFNSDGSITNTFSSTENITTVFNADGSISNILTIDSDVIEHRTVFNADGSITVTDQPYVPPTPPEPPVIPESLEDATWQEISNTIADGTFSQYASVGDTKSFEIGGKTYHAEVVAINDGTGDASQWYPDKTVDFICTELYETEHRYNSSDTNSGGFPFSEIKDTLNNIIYPLLPTDLKNVIIDKSHLYQAGSYSSSWSSSMSTLATKLWLPTHYEIVGTTDANAVGETSSNNKAYTLASNIKMLNGQTSAGYWWLGSPNCGYSARFSLVSANGGISGNNASVARGVPICFRIGGE